MYKMSQYMIVAAFITLVLATLCYAAHVVLLARGRRQVALRPAPAAGGALPLDSGIPLPGLAWQEAATPAARYATLLAVNSQVFLTFALLFRVAVTGHGPFSNMFEFSLSFAWGIGLVSLWLERYARTRVLGVPAGLAAIGLIWYATTVPSDVQPLVPALQNNLLLSVHVASAIIAYGTFAAAFGAAVLYLVQRRANAAWLPSPDLLDDVGYRAITLGFPMMALVLILGALWAEVAWGAYWSWDPKETASLVTWLLYGAYLHARNLRGWRGTRSAVLLLVGFGATLFTYFGNLFFGGLHSYSGLG